MTSALGGDKVTEDNKPPKQVYATNEIYPTITSSHHGNITCKGRSLQRLYLDEARNTL